MRWKKMQDIINLWDQDSDEEWEIGYVTMITVWHTDRVIISDDWLRRSGDSAVEGLQAAKEHWLLC